jgi:TonB family protein
MPDEAKVIALRPRPPGRPRKAKRPWIDHSAFPVEEGMRSFDPLSRDARNGHGVKTGAFYIGFAVLFHVGLSAALIALGNREAQVTRPREPQNVVVNIRPPELPKEEPAAAEATPEPTPIPKTIKAAPRPAKRAPVDPVDIQKTPQPETPPQRRVVGISFESTVQGGKGPALAVGNTRMGETDARAKDPSDVSPKAGSPYRGRGADTQNQVADAIPMDGLSFVKPKRVGVVTPEYPSLLKAQGIEGDTTVLVRISEQGAILDVKIVKSSGEAAFDDAALTAAKKEHFEPALRNGTAVPYTLKYTYRFQIKDQ